MSRCTWLQRIAWRALRNIANALCVTWDETASSSEEKEPDLASTSLAENRRHLSLHSTSFAQSLAEMELARQVEYYASNLLVCDAYTTLLQLLLLLQQGHRSVPS